MARGNPNWAKNDPTTWSFRIHGISHDGTMVTLGSYQTEREAKAHYDALVAEGYYDRLKVQTIKPKPADSTDSAPS